MLRSPSPTWAIYIWVNVNAHPHPGPGERVLGWCDVWLRLVHLYQIRNILSNDENPAATPPSSVSFPFVLNSHPPCSLCTISPVSFHNIVPKTPNSLITFPLNTSPSLRSTTFFAVCGGWMSSIRIHPFQSCSGSDSRNCGIAVRYMLFPPPSRCGLRT